MSAYKWLVVIAALPIAAVLIGLMNAITNPMVDMLNTYSTSQASAQGVAWYGTLLDWMPFVVLALFAFAVVVAVITRRRRVGV